MPNVTFIDGGTLWPTREITVRVDHQCVGTIRKADDGDQWYTYGLGGKAWGMTPVICGEDDLGSALRDAKAEVRRRVTVAWSK